MTKATYTPQGRNQLAERTAQQWVVPVGLVASIVWLLVFRLHPPIPISGWPSIGAGALISSVVVTLFVFPIGYLKGTHYAAHYNPALNFSLIRKLFSVVTLTIAFSLVTAILIGVGTFIFNLSFKDLLLDQYSSAVIVGVVTAVTTYAIFATSIRLTTQDIVNAFSTFMVVGVFSSMITSQNPYWWQENFSSLGTTDSVSSLAFNYTLILSGLLMVCMSQHLFADLNLLTGTSKQQKINANWIRALFVFIALCLAGVGFFPYNQQPQLHNFSAYSMAFGFAALVVGLRWFLPSIDKAFLRLSYFILGAMVVAEILFNFVHYLNLTAFELLAFSLTFVWLVLFLRTINLMLSSKDMNKA